VSNVAASYEKGGCGLHIVLYAELEIRACLSFRTRSANRHIGALFSGGIGHVRRHLVVVLVTINKVRT